MTKYRGRTSLEYQISKLAKSIPKKNKENYMAVYNISKNWNKIIGEKYAKYCHPKKIATNQFKKSTLFICAYNSASAFALDASKNDIIEKIACYFGYKLIDYVRITQEIQEIEDVKIKKPLKADDIKIIKDKISNIKDKKLQKTLQKLGEDILRKKDH